MTLDPLPARDLAVQDQLVAVLREARGILTTEEVCHLAGPVLRCRPCYAWRHRAGAGRGWRLVGCYGPTDLIEESVMVDQVGPRLLSRLEEAGLVRSAVRGPRRVRVWWLVIRHDHGSLNVLDEFTAWDVPS